VQSKPVICTMFDWISVEALVAGSSVKAIAAGVASVHP
jgi:hypothetical protein